MIALPEPGPERDTLIAEYVMGWKPSHRSPFMVWFYDKHGDARPMKESWSTCDATALEVVEAMQRDSSLWNVAIGFAYYPSQAVTVTVEAVSAADDAPFAEVESESLADAITAAALRAIGICS